MLHGQFAPEYLVRPPGTPWSNIGGTHFHVAAERLIYISGIPNYTRLEENEGLLLKKINQEIYARKKSADFLIGHAYFMAGIETSKVLKNKVIPLLMEYFSGKIDVVEEILKDTGWNITYDIQKYDWNVEFKL